MNFQMNPMKNKNPSPGSINPLYQDARTNIGLMRASAAYSAPIQSTLPNNLRQVSQQKSGQESQREHPFVQLIMQQQQQRNSVSTGGVRRSNNGATTQFKTPASIFPAQPRQQQQQPQQPAQQPQQPRQQQPQQPAQQPQQSAQQQQQLQTLQSDAQSLTETVQLLEEKISILEVFAADQVRELGRLRDELEISSIGTLRVRILDGGSEVYSDRSVFTGESVETLAAGTVLKVSYPFEENEEGIWASKQVVELTDRGLMLTGRYFLLAERTQSEIFNPKVSIISKV